MFTPATNTGAIQNTSYKVVIPFYVYAGFSFLAATILLFISSSNLNHYFQPNLLATTHAMTLGWGTMIILGASHQLVPVLIESKLYSNTLAWLSFALAGIGIPVLITAFFNFNMGTAAETGGILINAALLCYLLNLFLSISKSKHENVHAIFVFTAVIWLLITTIIGLLLVYNFRYNFFKQDSLHYLSLHAHIGILGWFLLLIIGVGTRLIPMFMISKYSNNKLLWAIYFLINAAIISFIILFISADMRFLYLIPLILSGTGIILFMLYCRNAYKERIRKKIDQPVKISLLSVFMTLIPFLILLFVIFASFFIEQNVSFILLYGFTVFFGWITAIILGMTFKTLPFIVWNKVYHTKAGLAKTPNPKDLFSENIFRWMAIFYLTGFVLFALGLLIKFILLVQIASLLLVVTAILYNSNLLKMVWHKSIIK